MLRGGKGAYPYHEGNHLIVAIDLTVFADESGIQKDARYCVMAGYIGSPRSWKLLNNAWARVLAEYGVPEFHAKDFFPKNRRLSRDHYAGWSGAKSTAFIRALATAIDESPVHAVCGALNVEAFNALTYGERRFLTGGNVLESGRWVYQGAPNQPYRFAFVQLLRDAVGRAKDGTLVHWVFDRQNEYEGGVLQEYQEIVASQAGADKIIDTTKLGSIRFASRLHEPSLQPADLLAHCWYTELTRREHPTEERAWAMHVLSNKRREIRVLEANDFDQFFLDGEKYGIDRELLRRMGPHGL